MFRHHEFDLHFAPVALVSGKYAPSLRVEQAGAVKSRWLFVPGPPFYDTEREASEAARAFGIRWAEQQSP